MSVTSPTSICKGRFTYAVPAEGCENRRGLRARIGRSRPFTPPTPDYIARGILERIHEATTDRHDAELEGMKAAARRREFRAYATRIRRHLFLRYGMAAAASLFRHRLLPGRRLVGSRRCQLRDSGEGSASRQGQRDARRRGRAPRPRERREPAKVASGEDSSVHSAPRLRRRAREAASAFFPRQIVLALEPGRYDVGIEARDEELEPAEPHSGPRSIFPPIQARLDQRHPVRERASRRPRRTGASSRATCRSCPIPSAPTGFPIRSCSTSRSTVSARMKRESPRTRSSTQSSRSRNGDGDRCSRKCR